MEATLCKEFTRVYTLPYGVDLWKATCMGSGVAEMVRRDVSFSVDSVTSMGSWHGVLTRPGSTLLTL